MVGTMGVVANRFNTCVFAFICARIDNAANHASAACNFYPAHLSRDLSPPQIFKNIFIEEKFDPEASTPRGRKIFKNIFIEEKFDAEPRYGEAAIPKNLSSISIFHHLPDLPVDFLTLNVFPVVIGFFTFTKSEFQFGKSFTVKIHLQRDKCQPFLRKLHI